MIPLSIVYFCEYLINQGTVSSTLIIKYFKLKKF